MGVSAPVLIRIPRGERQKHNQKCSSKKKRHNGSPQTFLARTFPAGLQAHPRSALSSTGFRRTGPALPGSSEPSSSSPSMGERATAPQLSPPDPLPWGPGLSISLRTGCESPSPRVSEVEVFEDSAGAASGVCGVSDRVEGSASIKRVGLCRKGTATAAPCSGSCPQERVTQWARPIGPEACS